MTAKNKWNNRFYTVIKINNSTVVLKRNDDGKEFEIEKSEFNFSYRIENQAR